MLYKSIADKVKKALFKTDPQQKTERAFTKIYDKKIWGHSADGNGTSGPGSTVDNAKIYMKFLQDFLEKNNIKSVVDVGCGDWCFSQHMNWTGISYSGYDVVKSVIEENNRKFSSENIKFFHGDVIHTDLPCADLLICKDVLQHLPNQAIIDFLGQSHKFKHCLITNDLDCGEEHASNRDINPGRYRTLDLTQSPFNLSGSKILTYITEPERKKQVIHIRL